MIIEDKLAIIAYSLGILLIIQIYLLSKMWEIKAQLNKKEAEEK